MFCDIRQGHNHWHSYHGGALMEPRGIRLNNPFNIRISDNHWIGKTTPSRDESFETFDTPEHGIRAGIKVLLTYFHKYSLKTIHEIISRFAPPSENDTDAYIASVTLETGIPAEEALDLDDPYILATVAMAIIKHEQGKQPYTAAQFLRGIEQATNAAH